MRRFAGATEKQILHQIENLPLRKHRDTKTKILCKKNSKVRKRWNMFNMYRIHSRHYTTNYFIGVSFTPLYSKEIVISNENVTIFTKDNSPCLGMMIDDILHVVYHRGKWAETYMCESEVKRKSKEEVIFDINRNIIKTLGAELLIR